MAVPAMAPQPMSMRLLATWRRFIHWLTKPHVVLALIMFVLMFYMVIIPLYKLVETTVTWQSSDLSRVPDAVVGELTIFHWVRMLTGVFGTIYTYTPLKHSMTIAIGTVVLALLIGGSLAWLVVRTDMPFRRAVAVFAVIPYVLPSYTLALAWLDFFKNERIGGAAGIYQYLFGAPTPDWLAYGFLPIVITLSLHYYPFTYLLLSGALVSIDAHLEECGEVLGASRFTILRRITFPIVLPALLSAFILTFSRALGTFGTPYFLGAPVRYFTLSTTIYSNIVNRTPAVAYISALVLIQMA